MKAFEEIPPGLHIEWDSHETFAQIGEDLSAPGDAAKKCPAQPAKEPISHQEVLTYLGVPLGVTLFLWLIYGCMPSFSAAPVRPESLVTSKEANE